MAGAGTSGASAGKISGGRSGGIYANGEFTKNDAPATTPSSSPGSWWYAGGSGGGGGFNLGSRPGNQNSGPAPTANVKDADANAIKSAYAARQNEATGKINDVYDKGLASAKQELKGAFEQNLMDQQYAQGQIGTQYQKAANDAAIQYERNKRNLNAQAAANGLSTGGGTQQQLALNQLWNTEYGNLRASEAKAMADSEQAIAKLKNQYYNDIAKAVADNDYKRAAALMDDFNNQRTWMDEQAKQMAAYGNFAGYGQTLGKDVANSMAMIWARQNPEAAWAAGMIDDATYKKASGQQTPGLSIFG